MSKIDPFELREPIPKSNEKKLLTFRQIDDIIIKHMDEVKQWPPSIWGFTRGDILEALEDLREKVKDTCRR